MTIEKIREKVNSNEYDFLRTNKNLGDNIVLLGLGGSHAYEINTTDSDLDIRGVATRNCKDILLGNDFENIVETNTDTTIYSFDKICNLLSNCNPNVIELLGLRPEHYLYVSDAGQMLLDNKSIFLSKRCIQSFGGYANQQLYRLQQKSLVALSEEDYNAHISRTLNNMKEHLYDKYGLICSSHIDENGVLMLSLPNIHNVPLEDVGGVLSELNNTYRDYTKASKRNEHALAHNKICKHAMHLLRLYMMANDILRDGEIVTYREKEHDLLMSIRNKEFYIEETGQMNKEFFDVVKEYEEEFNELKKTTKLPDNPDYEKIDELRYKVNKMIVTT